MARSIHKTRRDLLIEKHFEYSDPNLKKERTDSVNEKLEHKRDIKAQVREERLKPKDSLPPVAIETIPIVTLDKNEYIHYPAGPGDLMAVMQRLPKGMIDGISSISLCLGAERQKDYQEENLEPDPFIGRLGWEELPGVFGGKVRGSYKPGTDEIRLYAFVYDPCLPDKDMWELYLRLEMLSTFVHEIAHHFDFTRRVARGRWLARGEEKVEGYAEESAHELVKRYVIPYLELAYKETTKALEKWISDFGGVATPLSSLVRDPDNPLDGFFSIRQALEDLAFDVAKGVEPLEARCDFARHLHYAEHYEKALEVISRILAEKENHLDALALKADICWHQDRLDLAQQLAQEVLAQDGDFVEAWRVLANVYESKQQWTNLLDATDHILAQLEPGDPEREIPLADRARANLHLGNIEGFEAVIKELSEFGGLWASRAISRLRQEMNSVNT